MHLEKQANFLGSRLKQKQQIWNKCYYGMSVSTYLSIQFWISSVPVLITFRKSRDSHSDCQDCSICLVKWSRGTRSFKKRLVRGEQHHLSNATFTFLPHLWGDHQGDRDRLYSRACLGRWDTMNGNKGDSDWKWSETSSPSVWFCSWAEGLGSLQFGKVL